MTLNISPGNHIRRDFSTNLPRIMGDGYEDRPGQLEMALDVLGCFETDRIAVIEAETGLGKSIAYLLPLLRHCLETGSRAVISTNTRTLQQQLIAKDFPQARRGLGREIEAATLLGRTNYVCRLGVRNILKTAGLAGDTADWLREAGRSDHGEIENLPGGDSIDPAIRRKMICPAREAICKGCRLREGCYLLQARRRALSAQVVFVNHALLFSDLAAGNSLLGPYDLLVVDEAHHLHEVATDFFSLSFSPRSIKGGPHSLYTTTYEEIISYAREIVTADDPEQGSQIELLWKQFHKSLELAYQTATELFSRFDHLMSGSVRDSSPPGRPGGSGTSVRYTEGSPLLQGSEAESDVLRQELGRMIGCLERLGEILSGHQVLADAGTVASLRLLEDVARETREQLAFVLSAGDDDYVFYAGISAEGAMSNLAASPIDVSAQLGAFLEEHTGSAVLTSATLSVGEDFSYILRQFGLSGSRRVDTRRYSSPFDLDRQREVFLAAWLPDPRQVGFLAAAADTIGQIAEAVPRKTLVLCTSHQQLGTIQRTFSARPQLEPLVLAQTAGSSRNDLMDRFRRQPDKRILLGLVSFWEGVDFPGELLELVIIVKMPFLVPTEPVAQARAERMRAVGEDPFMEYILPDSILKLRQGSGRLIRTGRDRGAVIVLDSRLDHRPYGEVVLAAVYNQVIRAGSGEELLAGLDSLFGHESNG